MSDHEPVFKTRDRRQLYEFVEDQDGVTEQDLVDSEVLRDPDRIRQLIAVMKRDGLLTEEDGVLRTGVEAGDDESFEIDGLTVTIRPARQTDISGIVGVIRHVTTEKRYVVAETVEQQLSGDSTLIDTGLEHRQFFVATIDGEVVGWCGLSIPEMEKLRHTAELTLGVLEEYRGRSVGGHLLERGMRWADAAGLHKVYNSIPAANEEGLEFLGNHGWHTEAIRNDHYRIDDAFVDEVMMARTFE